MGWRYLAERDPRSALGPKEPMALRYIIHILVLLPLLSTAQEDVPTVHHTPRGNYLFPQETQREYILRSDVAMRTAPIASAGLVAPLSAGAPVTIEERSAEELQLQGLTSAWYRVVSGSNTGWVWGGHIAQRSFGSNTDATVKFVGGIDHITPSDTGIADHSYRIVALRNGKEVDRIVVRTFAHGFDEVNNHGNLGVPLVDDIITLRVPCIGGCGCTTGEVVVFWSGGSFHKVADLMGSPDGAYSTNVSFIYASDMEGIATTIIRVISDYQDPPDDENANMSYITRFVRREYLRWDGRKLGPSGRATEEERYRMTVD